MIEMCESEYLQSKVEDGELIAVLSFYDHLPASEAIALKDNLLYKDDENGRFIGSAARAVQFGPDMVIMPCVSPSGYKDQRSQPQKASSR